MLKLFCILNYTCFSDCNDYLLFVDNNYTNIEKNFKSMEKTHFLLYDNNNNNMYLLIFLNFIIKGTY